MRFPGIRQSRKVHKVCNAAFESSRKKSHCRKKGEGTEARKVPFGSSRFFFQKCTKRQRTFVVLSHNFYHLLNCRKIILEVTLFCSSLQIKSSWLPVPMVLHVQLSKSQCGTVSSDFVGLRRFWVAYGNTKCVQKRITQTFNIRTQRSPLNILSQDWVK